MGAGGYGTPSSTRVRSLRARGGLVPLLGWLLAAAMVVAHEGDMVHGLGKRAHWDVADAAHGQLDAAGIPYSVLPGNHDMSKAGLATLYDEYSPPSRFAGKPWYLGYLGDSVSGTRQGTGRDNVADSGLDRLNKNNYQVVRPVASGWSSSVSRWTCPDTP